MNTSCFNLELRMKQNDCTSIWFFHSKIVNNSNTFKVIFIEFDVNLLQLIVDSSIFNTDPSWIWKKRDESIEIVPVIV